MFPGYTVWLRLRRKEKHCMQYVYGCDIVGDGWHHKSRVHIITKQHNQAVIIYTGQGSTSHESLKSQGVEEIMCALSSHNAYTCMHGTPRNWGKVQHCICKVYRQHATHMAFLSLWMVPIYLRSMCCCWAEVVVCHDCSVCVLYILDHISLTIWTQEVFLICKCMYFQRGFQICCQKNSAALLRGATSQNVHVLIVDWKCPAQLIWEYEETETAMGTHCHVAQACAITLTIV